MSQPWTLRKWPQLIGLVATVMLIALPILVVLLVVWSVASDPLGMKESDGGHFPNALSWAWPDPWRKGSFVGYGGADAAFLDSIDQGREFNRRLQFVDADTPSTGNLVVSVNPIDEFTWAATTLSSNGRCYAQLVSHDRADPEHGKTFFAKFPAGAPCAARLATLDTVRSTQPPR